MIKHNISCYQIIQGLGKDPVAYHSSTRKKLNGDKSMSREEFIQIVGIIADLSHTPLTTGEIDYEVERVKVK